MSFLSKFCSLFSSSSEPQKSNDSIILVEKNNANNSSFITANVEKDNDADNEKEDNTIQPIEEKELTSSSETNDATDLNKSRVDGNLYEFKAIPLFSKIKELLDEERWQGYMDFKKNYAVHGTLPWDDFIALMQEEDNQYNDDSHIYKTFSVPFLYKGENLLLTFRYNVSQSINPDEPRLTFYYESNEKCNSITGLNKRFLEAFGFYNKVGFEISEEDALYDFIYTIDIIESYFLASDIEIEYSWEYDRENEFASSKSYRSNSEIEAEINWLKKEFALKYYKINYSRCIQEIIFPNNAILHFLKFIDCGTDRLFRLFIDPECWTSTSETTVFGYLLKEDDTFQDEIDIYKLNIFFDEQEEQLMIKTYQIYIPEDYRIPEEYR